MTEMESFIKFPQLTNYSFFAFSSVLCLTTERGRDVNLGGLCCFQLALKTPFSTYIHTGRNKKEKMSAI